MAKLPTPEETGDRIIDIIKEMNVRAGETAPIMGIQQRLGSNYRANDIQAAFDHLQHAGKLEPARDGFVKLTQAGYGPEPSSDEITRAVLDVLGDYSIRAGDALPTQPIAINLMKQGYSGGEIADAIEGLAADGLVELRNDTPFLTEEGFAAI
jgi:hypothetical protein